MIRTILLAGAIAFGATSAGAAEWKLIHEQLITAPSGPSYSADLLVASTEPVIALRVELVNDGGVCGARTTAVDVTHDANQNVYTRYYPNAEGVFNFSRPGLHWVVFHNHNPRLTRAYCRRIVYGLVDTDDGGSNDPVDFTYAGFVTYDGGFRNRLQVEVDAGAKVEAFWVRVPEFCQNLEVLEAGTITEGYYEAADLIDADQQIYEVNGGAGSRISAIALTLNGPRGAACDIPVYVRTKR